MEYESECDVNSWYEASRAIVKVYNDLIASKFTDNYSDDDFNTPTRFTLMMQVMIQFHAGQEMELEMLKKEIDELNAELAKYKYRK